MSAIYFRDLLIALRAGGGALTGLLFFLAVIAVMPFALGPDMALLGRLGPAILWIGALLAGLLGLDRIFAGDREDGSLDAIVGGSDFLSLVLTALAKGLAHWTASLLPIVIAAPVFGVLVNTDWTASLAVALTLLVGTPALSLVGVAGAAVAVALPRGGVLVSVLILPFVIPTLIFGVSAAYGAGTDAFWPPFLLLCASTLFLGVVGPVAAALALREGD
ncbi:heme exporter protein CcmB [Mesorhizobium sp. RP14(2022)]|uniref:Heme exporter protein B n=1 Tax=Mesorhizobium liriopis TaxID=2953882 RepID=A0ABT1C1W4_9HYPH|nr:heme exporter protein CcmB [Mesorhizobium liriopis]